RSCPPLGTFIPGWAGASIYTSLVAATIPNAARGAVLASGGAFQWPARRLAALLHGEGDRPLAPLWLRAQFSPGLAQGAAHHTRPRGDRLPPAPPIGYMILVMIRKIIWRAALGWALVAGGASASERRFTFT